MRGERKRKYLSLFPVLALAAATTTTTNNKKQQQQQQQLRTCCCRSPPRYYSPSAAWSATLMYIFLGLCSCCVSVKKRKEERAREMIPVSKKNQKKVFHLLFFQLYSLSLSGSPIKRKRTLAGLLASAAASPDLSFLAWSCCLVGGERKE